MPAGFDSFDDFRARFSNLPADAAETLWNDLQREAEHEYGNAEELVTAIEEGAGYIADVGVEILSGVDLPAIDSEMVMLKSAKQAGMQRPGSWGGETDILLVKEDDTEKRISYAAAMEPREPDKEGDVVSTPQVEMAAHGYLKHLKDADGDGVDTDHNLIDDAGHVIESWLLKEDREFELADGGTKSHEPGTWMVGIEWEAEPWERIKAGELTGLSIYGMADHIQLDKSTAKQPDDDPCWEGYEMVGMKTDEFGNEVPNCVPEEQVNAMRALKQEFDIPLADDAFVHLVYESERAAEQASEEMGLGGAVHEHELDDMTVFMPGETHDDFVEVVANDAKEFGGPIPDNITTMDGCISWAEDNTDVEEPAAFCQSNKVESDAKDRQTATDDGQTVKGDIAEPNTQNSTMSATDNNGGDTSEPTNAEKVGDDDDRLERLESEVDRLTDVIENLQSDVRQVTELTEVSDGGGQEQKQSVIEEAVEMLAESDELDAGSEAIASALRELENAEDDDDDEEHEDDEHEDEYERSVEDAEFGKGHSGEGVREAATEKRHEQTATNGSLSYAELLEQQEGN